jgi:methionyl-tRNA synthetase
MGAISPSTGRTLPDRYIEGTCPICGYDGARGDQCDNCGNQLDPIDLINPRSRINGETPVFGEEEHYMLDLPAFTETLGTYLQSKQGEWRPNVLKFALNLLDDMRPRAYTRDLDWGVPVPLPGWEDNPHKRIYVWFDAVIGYLSASIEWAAQRGEPDAWKDWWQSPSTHYYVMGKDNITFHTVMWPAILMGAGDLHLPDAIVASEFLHMEGKKLSTSRGQVVYVRDMLDRYDADALRYYLMIAGPENQDTDFTWTEFVRRNNDELVATWGNLVHRTLVNVHRNFGEVPTPNLTEREHGIIGEVEEALGTVEHLLEQARFQVALKYAMTMAAKVNVYLGTEQPWHTIKTDRERAGSVLYAALRCVDNLKTMLTPFLPFSSQRLHRMLGYDDVIAPQPDVRHFTEEGGSHTVITGDYPSDNRWRVSELAPGRMLPQPEALFKRLDDVVEEEPAPSS